MNVTQHLDYDTLNALKDIMEDDFVFLIETYLQDSQDRLAILHGLNGTNDYDATRRAAHSFKGSCSNLGAVRLASLCALLERRALEQKLDNLGTEIAEIEEEFLTVKNMMLEFLA